MNKQLATFETVIGLPAEEERTIFITCPWCDGGGWRGDDAFHYGEGLPFGRCPKCHGTGVLEEPLLPISVEDLDRGRYDTCEAKVLLDGRWFADFDRIVNAQRVMAAYIKDWESYGPLFGRRIHIEDYNTGTIWHWIGGYSEWSSDDNERRAA